MACRYLLSLTEHHERYHKDDIVKESQWMFTPRKTFEQNLKLERGIASDICGLRSIIQFLLNFTEP